MSQQSDDPAEISSSVAPSDSWRSPSLPYSAAATSTVSGPTGAMTVVLVPIVVEFGADVVLVVGMLAGFILIALAIANAGRYMRFLPLPVIEGFTIGIAVIIGLQQADDSHGTPRAALQHPGRTRSPTEPARGVRRARSRTSRVQPHSRGHRPRQGACRPSST